MLPTLSPTMSYYMSAATAIVAVIMYMALRPAAGMPALQALAAAIWLASGLASIAVWHYSAWCSSAAAVSMLLAGTHLA